MSRTGNGSAVHAVLSHAVLSLTMYQSHVDCSSNRWVRRRYSSKAATDRSAGGGAATAPSISTLPSGSCNAHGHEQEAETDSKVVVVVREHNGKGGYRDAGDWSHAADESKAHPKLAMGMDGGERARR